MAPGIPTPLVTARNCGIRSSEPFCLIPSVPLTASSSRPSVNFSSTHRCGRCHGRTGEYRPSRRQPDQDVDHASKPTARPAADDGGTLVADGVAVRGAGECRARHGSFDDGLDPVPHAAAGPKPGRPGRRGHPDGVRRVCPDLPPCARGRCHGASSLVRARGTERTGRPSRDAAGAHRRNAGRQQRPGSRTAARKGSPR